MLRGVSEVTRWGLVSNTRFSDENTGNVDSFPVNKALLFVKLLKERISNKFPYHVEIK